MMKNMQVPTKHWGMDCDVITRIYKEWDMLMCDRLGDYDLRVHYGVYEQNLCNVMKSISLLI